jgi:hypothetical protein
VKRALSRIPLELYPTTYSVPTGTVWPPPIDSDKVTVLSVSLTPTTFNAVPWASPKLGTPVVVRVAVE